MGLAGAIVEIKDGTKPHAQDLGHSPQDQVGGILSACFDEAEERAIEPAFTRKMLLRPVLLLAQFSKALSEPPKDRMRSRTRRHQTMLPMADKDVYRPWPTTVV